jgi:hypothetical protein
MNCKESPISARLRAVYNRGSDGCNTLSRRDDELFKNEIGIRTFAGSIPTEVLASTSEKFAEKSQKSRFLAG